ncbi:hypothetical protein BGZ97_000459 [Linnemannia gamsii]|uniref:DNA polymerase delta subunit 4 n=1 Tax=Linnemannia gamsii TaxID=64522 RepID=A0A9P6UK96_9FUNG|nr:hypothetical protein BGZ97_000459 [Linnemannia gamsii]
MAPKKATSPKPTATDRVSTTKKAALFKSTPVSKHSNNFTDSNTNDTLKTEKQQGRQDQHKLFWDTTTTTTTSHAVIVISDNEGDDDDRNEAAWGFGDDLGRLDDLLSDDPFGSQQLQSELLPQVKAKEDVDEPLITPVMSRASSAKRSHSQLVATPSICIKHGIHQKHISEQEKILRQFDLTSKYGPCLDMTRLERWERASQLGLSPPMDVKDMLVKDKALNTPLLAGRV